MYLLDLFLTESPNNTVIEPTAKGYATEKDDQSVLSLSDMRKTRLTLGQINKLRQMNDIRKVEHKLKMDNLSTMYKPAATDDGGMGM